MNRTRSRTLVPTAMAVVLGILAASASSMAAAPATYQTSALEVEVIGKGQPMVFIPGLTCPGEAWRETATHYADRYQCHLVTLAGFGGTPRFEGPFIDTARDSLLAYFKARHLTRPVIVGHSLGGVLAMELATTAPEAVGPLVIVDALPFLGGAGDTTATAESARQRMEPMWKMMRSQTQEAYVAYQKNAPYLRSMVAPGPNFDRVLEWATTADRIAVADAMYDISSRDLRDRLPGLRSPMLVLGSWYGMKEFSTKDAIEATFRRQYARAPQWTLALADTARHFIMLDSPQWTWTQMDTFLGAAGPSGRTSAKTR